MTNRTSRTPGEPRRAVPVDDQAFALTFFLSARQRREVLRVLGRAHPDRTRALLMTLRVQDRSGTGRTQGGDR